MKSVRSRNVTSRLGLVVRLVIVPRGAASLNGGIARVMGWAAQSSDVNRIHDEELSEAETRVAELA